MFGNILFILRFTRNKSISARWILSEHERSVISKHYEEMIGKADRSTKERKKKNFNVANIEKYLCSC